MSDRPLIGVTSNVTGTGVLDGAAQCPRAYTEALAAAGGLPVVIPVQADAAAAEALVATLGGILFTGGRDIHPRRYGHDLHPAADVLDPRREEWDLLLLAAALRHPSLPILGICLGIQELNVALGGTLTQHLPDLGSGLEHRAPETGDRLHGVTPCPGTRLAAILGEGTVRVTTRHHQAIAQPAPGVAVAAHAIDGIVEAIEWGGPGRFVVGVQWHPERNADSPESRALFRAFVGACTARRTPDAPHGGAHPRTVE